MRAVRAKRAVRVMWADSQNVKNIYLFIYLLIYVALISHDSIGKTIAWMRRLTMNYFLEEDERKR